MNRYVCENTRTNIYSKYGRFYYSYPSDNIAHKTNTNWLIKNTTQCNTDKRNSTEHTLGPDMSAIGELKAHLEHIDQDKNVDSVSPLEAHTRVPF
jgi:hypothetical protein